MFKSTNKAVRRHSYRHSARSVVSSILSIGLGVGAECAVMKVTDNNAVAGMAAYLVTALPCQYVLNRYNDKIENNMLIADSVLEFLHVYREDEGLNYQVVKAFNRACTKHHIDDSLIPSELRSALMKEIKINAEAALQKAYEEAGIEA